MQIAIVQQEKTLCAAKRDNLVRRIMRIINAPPPTSSVTCQLQFIWQFVCWFC